MTKKQDTLNKTIAIVDSIRKINVDTKEEPVIRKPEYDSDLQSDSLHLDKNLQKALNYAILHKYKNSFMYQQNNNDTFFNVTTQLIFGNLFSKDKKHLIVRRISPPSVICNVFLLKNQQFKQVLESVHESLTYFVDTLRDVNGDGFKDYLVHSYPASGCCRRNVYNVFLYFPKTGQFTTNYTFINPTFSPKEKIIRGVEYGYSSALYKYKWHKLNVDTLEFIYRDSSNTKKFYLAQKSDYHRPPLVKNKMINKIPKEYETIEDLDWFLNN